MAVFLSMIVRSEIVVVSENNIKITSRTIYLPTFHSSKQPVALRLFLGTMLSEICIFLGMCLVGLGLPEPVALIFYGVSLMAYGFFIVI
jgi:hypothetical protein